MGLKDCIILDPAKMPQVRPKSEPKDCVLGKQKERQDRFFFWTTMRE